MKVQCFQEPQNIRKEQEPDASETASNGDHEEEEEVERNVELVVPPSVR